MTVNNIDVIQWKADQRLRIIESKHTNERVKPTQLQVLTLLGKVFKQANKISRKYIFEVFIITGDYPFKTVKIEDLITGEKVICNNIDLFKKFSNLEIGFKELVKN